MENDPEKWRAALLRLKPTLSWALEDGCLTAGTNWFRFIHVGTPAGILRGMDEMNQLRELLTDGFCAFARGDRSDTSATIGGCEFVFDKNCDFYFNQQLITAKHHDRIVDELVAWIGLCVGNDSRPIDPADGYDEIIFERNGNMVLVTIFNNESRETAETKINREEARLLQQGLLALAAAPDNYLPAVDQDRVRFSEVALIAGGTDEFSRLRIDGSTGCSDALAVFNRIEAVCLAVELELLLEQFDNPPSP